MNTAYPKRLIEVDLPIKRISAHARREKSIRHGHISTLHIWWTQRPSRFRWFVIDIWRKWLSWRRCRGIIPWDQFYRLLGQCPLPAPIATHSV